MRTAPDLDIAELRSYLKTTEDYRRVFAQLKLDQECSMPDGATADRARQLGLIEGVIRERTGSDDLGRLLDIAEQSETDDRLERSVIECARRDHQTARRQPRHLMARFQELASTAFLSWRDARSQADYTLFAPNLARLVNLNREIADAIHVGEHPLDALMTMYEPGLSYQKTNDLLWGLKSPLVALNKLRLERLGDVSEPRVDLSRAEITSLVRTLASRLGYDWNRGGLAFSPHPYTSVAGRNDVRFTLRDNMRFVDMLRAAVHELGHALYEQGIDPQLHDTSAGRGIMPWAHESQAKFWENIICRDEGFAQIALNAFHESLPTRKLDIEPQQLHEALIGGPTSVIRVEADEITFNLHILLRWEIESHLLDGTLSVADVPELWNARSVEYFGTRPSTDAEGCLQDPHWCHRYLGLFPCYVVGNLFSAQLADSMRSDGIDITDLIAAQDFLSILDWLRSHVHKHGRLYLLSDLVHLSTGQPLGTHSYLQHLERRYGAI